LAISRSDRLIKRNKILSKRIIPGVAVTLEGHVQGHSLLLVAQRLYEPEEHRLLRGLDFTRGL